VRNARLVAAFLNETKTKNEMEKEFKGTQGEWTFKHGATNICSKESGRMIANSAVYSCNTDDGEHLIENEANAKLIASAPELLEALQHSLRLAESLPNKESVGVKMFVKAANKAINKALK
jgi:hypothetical protein